MAHVALIRTAEREKGCVWTWPEFARRYPQGGAPPEPVGRARSTSRSCVTGASTSLPGRGGRSAPAASTAAATSSSMVSSAPSGERTRARWSPWSSRAASPLCSTAAASCDVLSSGRDVRCGCGELALRRRRITHGVRRDRTGVRRRHGPLPAAHHRHGSAVVGHLAASEDRPTTSNCTHHVGKTRYKCGSQRADNSRAYATTATASASSSNCNDPRTGYERVEMA